MLIGELVPIALRFLQANPHAAVLPVYRAVLVDEFQDLNKADQALVDVLATKANLTVVGDDNQSIYRFRHANPEGIRVFPAQHPGAISHAIEECWRCPPNIVAMSNDLIAHDPVARQTPLTAQPGRAAASVYIVQHPTLGDEGDTLAAYIDQYLNQRNGLPPGQVLVLSPRRIFGNGVRDALIRRRRNAMSFFWEDALAADAAAEGFCLLTLLVRRDDRAAYRAWLGLGDTDGNRAGYTRVRAHAQEHSLEPFDVCEQLSAGQINLRYTEQDLDWKEQRRLFYVAITRAKHTLVLSSVTQLPLRVALKANIPPSGVFRDEGEPCARLAASPFIEELGPTPPRPRAIRGSDWRAALTF